MTGPVKRHHKARPRFRKPSLWQRIKNLFGVKPPPKRRTVKVPPHVADGNGEQASRSAVQKRGTAAGLEEMRVRMRQEQERKFP